MLSYHHAKRVREWLKRQGRKCVLHFIPPYCPHLDPIERCWGLMHEYTTHNRDYKTFDQFRAAILTFLNQTIPKKWEQFRVESTTTSASYHRPVFGLSLSRGIPYIFISLWPRMRRFSRMRAGSNALVLQFSCRPLTDYNFDCFGYPANAWP